MERIKFVIVEQSYLIRKGIASIINRIEHATVVKELENLDDINSVINKFTPDFLLVNTEQFKDAQKIRNFEIKFDLKNSGIGINHTYSDAPALRTGMREIINTMDSRDLIYSKLENIIRGKINSGSEIIKPTELSEREKTILRHVSLGETNKEIAEKLFLSTHTVITHRKNITNKLGIKTISGLTVYAILNNIIRIEDIG
ncbi:MAG: response regulator transcription factor [Bacteroidales bacterium]|nr:response regulator transcription factor [Bacteroidales bacterium]MCB8999779.1 response regulator transcription factor [Bacteroidales bacterium]